MADVFRMDAGWHMDDPIVRFDSFVPEPPSPPTKRKTMPLTTTEVFGFADTVTEAMTANTAELLTKGITVGPWKTEGMALKADAVTKDGLQETAKTNLKNATIATNAALQETYDFYSSKLDA